VFESVTLHRRGCSARRAVGRGARYCSAESSWVLSLRRASKLVGPERGVSPVGF